LYEGALHLIPDLLTDCNLKQLDIIQNAGHWVQFEAPDAFNQTLTRCLPLA